MIAERVTFTAHYLSPIGGITLSSDGIRLTGLWFDEIKSPESKSGITEERNLTVFDETRRWLDIYFNGRAPSFTPPLNIETSVFRRRVWQFLLDIPYGCVTTYGDIARRLGCRSAQAVGGAVAHNSILLIIPCHRVVGSDGSLTGYSGGIDRKIALLKMEGVTTNNLFPVDTQNT